MGEIFKYVREEWRVIKRAPFAFLGLLILGIAGGFSAGLLFRGQEVANAESVIKLKEEEIAAYKRGNGEMTPEQLKKLKEALGTNPSSVDITGNKDVRSQLLLQQLLDAFKESGWEVNITPPKAEDEFRIQSIERETIYEAFLRAGFRLDSLVSAASSDNPTPDRSLILHLPLDHPYNQPNYRYDPSK